MHILRMSWRAAPPRPVFGVRLPVTGLHASFSFRVGRSSEKAGGFTFLELAIVLIVVGVILSIGAASWITFMEGRRAVKTRSVLQQAKDCLVRRVVFNERYPREDDFDDCMGESGKDGWSRETAWLVGFDENNDALNGTMFVVRDAARNQNATYPDADSMVITSSGDQENVAFVLLSKGEDGAWDSSTYAGKLGESDPHVLDAVVPDFVSSHKDDIFLVVKGFELAASIKNAVGH